MFHGSNVYLPISTASNRQASWQLSRGFSRGFSSLVTAFAKPVFLFGGKEDWPVLRLSAPVSDDAWCISRKEWRAMEVGERTFELDLV